MNDQALTEKVQLLVAQNKAKDALQLLLTTARNKKRHRMVSQALLLMANLAKLKEDKRLNLDYPQNLGVRQAQINQSILNLVARSKSTKIPIWRTKRLILLFVLLCFGLGVVAIWKWAKTAWQKTGQQTVIVHGWQGITHRLLDRKGTLVMHYGNDNKAIPIGPRGEVTFKEVPGKFFERGTNVYFTLEVGNEPYTLSKTDTFYVLDHTKPIYLEVRLQGLDDLFGRVIMPTGNAVANAKVWLPIINMEVLTDSNGMFRFKIPLEKQRKFQDISAYKDGFQQYLKKDIPMQTEGEVIIMLSHL